jgi:hypothetical protein
VFYLDKTITTILNQTLKVFTTRFGALGQTNTHSNIMVKPQNQWILEFSLVLTGY